MFRWRSALIAHLHLTVGFFPPACSVSHLHLLLVLVILICGSVLTEPVVLPPILPSQALAVPLHLTSWRLQARPKNMGLFFCKVPIHWTTVERPGEISSSKRECQSADFDDSLKRSFRLVEYIGLNASQLPAPDPDWFLVCFRFCVVIKKENYPDQQPAKRPVSGSAQQIYRQPGHTVYLLPTMVLANLLPCDLNFYIKGTSITGSLKPGKEAVLHSADTSQNMELGQKQSLL